MVEDETKKLPQQKKEKVSTKLSLLLRLAKIKNKNNNNKNNKNSVNKKIRKLKNHKTKTVKIAENIESQVKRCSDVTSNMTGNENDSTKTESEKDALIRSLIAQNEALIREIASLKEILIKQTQGVCKPKRKKTLTAASVDLPSSGEENTVLETKESGDWTTVNPSKKKKKNISRKSCNNNEETATSSAALKPIQNTAQVDTATSSAALPAPEEATMDIDATCSALPIAITNDKTKPTSNSEVPKTAKPVPIVIRDISKWNIIMKDFKNLKIKHEIAKRTSSGISLKPTTVDDYRQAVRYLTNFKIQYHTHLLLEERSLNVVIKGLHGLPTEEIEEDLIEKGFHPHEVYYLKTRSKNGKSLIKVRLPRDEKNIYDLRVICHMTCTVEAQKANGEAPQCHNCNEFYHIASKCFAAPRCLKCAGNHHFKECKKPKDTAPKCCLCNGEHTANYGGCPKNPKNVKKAHNSRPQSTSQPQTKAPMPILQNFPPLNSHPSPPGSYAKPEVPEKLTQKSQKTTRDAGSKAIQDLFTNMQEQFNNMMQNMATAMISVMLPVNRS